MNIAANLTARNYIKSFWFVLVVLVSIWLLTGARLYQRIPEPASVQTAHTVGESRTLAAEGQQAPANQPATFTPFIAIIPSADGETIDVSVSGVGELAGTVSANVSNEDSPTGFKDGWTMSYSQTVSTYFVQGISGFDSGRTMAGTISITTTQGLDTGDLQFSRAFVPAASRAPIRSLDGTVELELVNTDVITVDTYVVVASNLGQPSPLPADLRLIGNAYSLRASGALMTTAKPMNLKFHYADVQLQGADPRTLDIFYWNLHTQQWQPLNAAFSPSDRSLSVATTFFGTYALLSQPFWQADFATLDHLDQQNQTNVVQGGLPGQRILTVRTPPAVGSAVTKPITPSFGLESWGAVYYTHTMTTPTATLTIDVLDAAGTLLLSNVASGESLAAIDPQVHSALRLRVNMTATLATPVQGLSAWRVTWQPPQPAVIRVGDAQIELGGTITVPVTLEMAPRGGVGGATLEMRYDPRVLQVGTCLSRPGISVLAFCNTNFDANSDALDAIRFTLIATPALTQTTTLAELSFRAVGAVEGGTRLDLAPVLVVDATGAPKPAVTEDGRVTITTQPSGDVNCDEQIDDDDVTLVLSYTVGLIGGASACPPPANALFLPHCDVNRDQACDLRDALLITP